MTSARRSILLLAKAMSATREERRREVGQLAKRMVAAVYESDVESDSLPDYQSRRAHYERFLDDMDKRIIEADILAAEFPEFHPTIAKLKAIVRDGRETSKTWQ